MSPLDLITLCSVAPLDHNADFLAFIPTSGSPLVDEKSKQLILDAYEDAGFDSNKVQVTMT